VETERGRKVVTIKHYMTLGFAGVEWVLFCNSLTIFMFGAANRRFKSPF
jgi:NAD/NADP transhydrogenase beta subunit